jgi:very-short-patch-repair endonuclease
MRARISTGSRSRAKALRTNVTDAERRLWQLLRAHRLEGLKFKRQVPLDGYVLDFVCFEARLIIEADGSQHFDAVSDELRDAHFAASGFLTVRIWNNEILQNPAGVWERIAAIADSRVCPPLL